VLLDTCKIARNALDRFGSRWGGLPRDKRVWRVEDALIVDEGDQWDVTVTRGLLACSADYVDRQELLSRTILIESSFRSVHLS